MCPVWVYVRDMMITAVAIGPVTNEQAKAILSSSAYGGGGGWGKIGGMDVYLSRGCHRENPSVIGWSIEQIGRSFG